MMAVTGQVSLTASMKSQGPHHMAGAILVPADTLPTSQRSET